jgi:hypothetical protein
MDVGGIHGCSRFCSHRREHLKLTARILAGAENCPPLAKDASARHPKGGSPRCTIIVQIALRGSRWAPLILLGWSLFRARIRYPPHELRG